MEGVAKYRGGLFWGTIASTSITALVLAIMFVLQVTLRLREWVGAAFEIALKIITVTGTDPFRVAFVLLPVLSLGLITIWWRVGDTAGDRDSYSGGIATLLIGGIVVAAWSWFTIALRMTAFQLYRDDAAEVLDPLHFLLTFDLPWEVWNTIVTVGLAAGVGLSVLAIVWMFRATAPVPTAASHLTRPSLESGTPSPGSLDTENKTCPMCAEEVKGAAVICRYCGYDFVRGSGSTGTQRTNGLAVASLVLGLLWLYGVGSLLAVIFGHLAIGQINASEGRQGGKGMAVAGAILGWIGVVSFVILLLAISSA